MLVWKFVFKINEGIKETRLVFPHLSPSPLIVPWTCLTPTLIAARAFATPFSVSLWAWIPNLFAGIVFLTSWIIFVISFGRVPPLVSHNTIHLTFDSKAVLKHFIA